VNRHLDQSEIEKSQAIFDSYCKTVIRNAGRNIYKRYKRQLQNEILMDFSVGGFLDETAQDNEFPSDSLSIMYEGKEFQVKSLELYEGLTQLPFPQLEVIILKYLCKHTDQQVADIIGTSARTVRNRRSRALNKLRSRWKGE
jgi:RNA polymerase sigma factor (sigma-70 family)